VLHHACLVFGLEFRFVKFDAIVTLSVTPTSTVYLGIPVR
jgi:hypothetical protein